MLQTTLEYKYLIPFVVISILYHIFDYGFNNLVLLYSTLYSENKEKDENVIERLLSKNNIIRIGIHIIITFIIPLAQEKYINFITNKTIEQTNKILTYNETLIIINNDNINNITQYNNLQEMCAENINLYFQSCGQLAKFIIAAVILFNKGEKIGIILPIGYIGIIFFLDFIYTKNNHLNTHNHKRVINYMILSYFVIGFPVILIKKYDIDVVCVLFYFFVIVTINFNSLNTFNIQNQTVKYLLNTMHPYKNDITSKTLALYCNTNNISIKKYFKLHFYHITDVEIIETLNNFDLIPDLYAINPQILEITMNNSEINSYVNTKISMARISLHNNENITNIICKNIDPECFKKHKNLLNDYNFIKDII